MVMFLPFLIALIAAFGVLYGRRQAAFVTWLLLVIVTVAWFKHHATDSLNLVF